MRHWLWLVGVLVPLTGCENRIVFEGMIQVDPAVAPSAGAPLLLLLGDDYRYPIEEDIEGMWDTKNAGFYLEAVRDRCEGAEGDPLPVAYEPGSASYSYCHAEVAYHPSRVYLSAVIDLNKDGEPSAGEPWGRGSPSPLQGAALNLDELDDGREPVGAYNTVDIFIDQIWPPAS